VGEGLFTGPALAARLAGLASFLDAWEPSPTAVDFPARPAPSEPLPGKPDPAFPSKNQRPRGSLSRIPAFPAPYGGDVHSGAVDLWFDWQERAAIREYDAGLSRDLAEALTVLDLGECPPPG